MASSRAPRCVADLRPLESQVQKAVVDALLLAGFTVRHTSAPHRTLISLAVPDLLVAHPEVPGLYFGLELKRNHSARRTPEQEAAVANGEYVIVASADEALARAEWFLRRHWTLTTWASRDRLSRVRKSLEGK